MHNKTTATGGSIARLFFLLSGIVLVALGLIAGSFGSGWSGLVFELFENIPIMETIGTYTPYFPFVAFFPIGVVVLGTLLIVKSRQWKIFFSGKVRDIKSPIRDSLEMLRV